jgi:membrane associated rhomboid family serine protease
MDIGLLFILLFGSAWLYGAVMLAAIDWRWNLYRIVEAGGLAGLSAFLLATERTGPEWLLVMTLLFLATALLPRLAQNYVMGLLARGRFRAAMLWQAALAALLMRTSPAQAEELARLGGLVRRVDPYGATPERRAFVLGRMALAASRRAFLAGELDAAVAMRDHGLAVALIEDLYGPGGLPPDAASLHAAAIVYAETGEAARALTALRRAEERLAAPDPTDLRRFLAFLHVYAACGRVEDANRMIELNPRIVTVFPAAFPSFWRGLALARAGREIESAGAFVDAVALTGPGEEGLRRYLQRRMSAPPPALAPGALEAEALEDLEVVRRFEGRPHALQAGLFIPARVVTTWALIGLCAAMFVVTEIFGSSTDSHTLVRFGANVPEWVQEGQSWRLLSGVFLHVGFLHLFFNVYACYILGGFVERLVGRWETFAVFILSGIGGSAASAFLGESAISAGASGAVMGLLGAATMIVLRFRGLLPPEARRMQLLSFLFIVGINVLYGLMEPRIDNFAHGGGFVTGAFVALFLAPPNLLQRRRAVFRAIGVALIGLMALTAWQVQGFARAHRTEAVEVTAEETTPKDAARAPARDR